MLPSPLELIKRSLDLYKKNKNLFLSATFILTIPIVLSGLFRIYFAPRFSPDSPLSSMAGAATVLFILYILTLYASISFIRIIQSKIQNTPTPSLKTELISSIHLVFPALIVVALTALCVFGGIILFIIPGIIFSIWYFYSVYALILDNKRGTEALHFSKKLVKGQWWDVLWILLCTTFLVVIVTIFAQFILSFILQLLLHAVASWTFLVSAVKLIGSILSIVIEMITVPVSAGTTTLLYNELKKLKNL